MIKFEDIKESLEKVLAEKIKETPIPNEKDFTLIKGFINCNVRPQTPEEYIVGGPYVPIIGIVGNTSGRIYTFALMSIMPELFEERKKNE